MAKQKLLKVNIRYTEDAITDPVEIEKIFDKIRKMNTEKVIDMIFNQAMQKLELLI